MRRSACFALLGEYVEQELGREADVRRREEDADCEWRSRFHRGYRLHSAGGTDERAIDLWTWYLGERARGFEPPQPEDGLPDYDAHADLYDAKLRELIDLRRTLWT